MARIVHDDAGEQRMKHERDALVSAALGQARARFETFAGMGHPELPPDANDATQVLLYRWQVNRFGLQSDERMALGVIEEIGETFEAGVSDDADPNEALDGLGDVCVYAAQLCTSNRLAIGPILDLAKVMQARGEVQPLLAVGKLAHAVLKHAQKIRGKGNHAVYQALLVEHLSQCIAKAADDCEIMHGLTVNSIPGVFQIVANEVMQRGAGHAAIPESFKERQEIPRADVTIAVPSRDEHELQASIARAQAVLVSGVEKLEQVAQVEPGDFQVANPTGQDLLNGRRDRQVFDLSDAGEICPQCAGLLSHYADTKLWRCSNGHEMTDAQHAASRHLP